MNAKKKSVSLYDGAHRVFSATRLANIGKEVVEVLNNQESCRVHPGYHHYLEIPCGEKQTDRRQVQRHIPVRLDCPRFVEFDDSDTQIWLQLLAKLLFVLLVFKTNPVNV